jgi:hypothetical protein
MQDSLERCRGGGWLGCRPIPMYAARNGFSCPNQEFSAISPPFFVFPRATPKNTKTLAAFQRNPVPTPTFSQIGLQEIANEELETISVIGRGPDFSDC